MAGLQESLPTSHRVPAVRGELLARLGDHEGAGATPGEAIALCRTGAERADLTARRDSLGAR